MPMPSRETTMTQSSAWSEKVPEAQGPIETIEEAQTQAYQYYFEPVVAVFKSNVDSGLREAEVKERQKTYGPNELQGETGIPYFKILLNQVVNAMTIVSTRRIHLGIQSASVAYISNPHYRS